MKSQTEHGYRTPLKHHYIKLHVKNIQYVNVTTVYCEKWNIIHKAMFITVYNHLHIVIIVFCLLNITYFTVGLLSWSH